MGRFADDEPLIHDSKVLVVEVMHDRLDVVLENVL
jgi:hypothetical protein